MKIRCNQFNEVRLQDVEKYIIYPSQIRRHNPRVGVFCGYIIVDDWRYPLYAGDEIVINNVSFSLAKGNFTEFIYYVEINNC